MTTEAICRKDESLQEETRAMPAPDAVLWLTIQIRSKDVLSTEA
jgi:hypothetical protein